MLARFFYDRISEAGKLEVSVAGCLAARPNYSLPRTSDNPIGTTNQAESTVVKSCKHPATSVFRIVTRINAAILFFAYLVEAGCCGSI
jgi:hypothetical protein